jgi:hypothetical protein
VIAKANKPEFYTSEHPFRFVFFNLLLFIFILNLFQILKHKLEICALSLFFLLQISKTIKCLENVLDCVNNFFKLSIKSSVGMIMKNRFNVINEVTWMPFPFQKQI